MAYVICLFGPSGAGKTTWKNKLVEKGIRDIRSYTTRKPREGEGEEDYKFISLEEWNRLNRDRKLANINNYHGEWYGIDTGDFVSADDSVLITDITSLNKLKRDLTQNNKQYKLVYCKEPSWKEVEKRHKKRNTKERIDISKREIQEYKEAKLPSNVVVLSTEEELENLFNSIEEDRKKNWKRLVF